MGAGPSARSWTAIWAMATARFQASEAAGDGREAAAADEGELAALLDHSAGRGREAAGAGAVEDHLGDAELAVQRLALRLEIDGAGEAFVLGVGGLGAGMLGDQLGEARGGPASRPRGRPGAGSTAATGGAEAAGGGAPMPGCAEISAGEGSPGQLPGQGRGAEDENEGGSREGRGAKKADHSISNQCGERSQAGCMRKEAHPGPPSVSRGRPLPIPRVRDGPPLSKDESGLGCALQQSQSSAFISAANRSADGISSSINHESGSKRLQRAMKLRNFA